MSIGSTLSTTIDRSFSPLFTVRFKLISSNPSSDSLIWVNSCNLDSSIMSPLKTKSDLLGHSCSEYSGLSTVHNISLININCLEKYINIIHVKSQLVSFYLQLRQELRLIKSITRPIL